MRNCPQINFSGDSRQLAATAQNLENKISEPLLSLVSVSTDILGVPYIM
ncbi:hypothetical protein [Kriegella aquimaris]|uniref:Uncharacterized protein n=1 Tax=Kriegella aquimaris TaxID=192904 RepID=A0A1G9YRX8_9FLAO|nr:hypothetical protein [Kriegella aquimaris]SDN11830.1 hypothetical protein SAMN04488514_12611 [Kriegella aquimaris]